MKKLTMGLMLSLISVSSLLACKILPLGDCSGNAYFQTYNFNPNSIYHFWVTGQTDTIMTFTTGSIVQDSTLSFDVAPGTSIEMSYAYIDSNDPAYVGWEHYDPAIASDYNYCGVLPASLSNFTVQKRSGSTVFSFDAGNETGVIKYEIMGSVNQKDWIVIQSVKPTGAKHYSIPITAGYVALFLPLLAIGFKKHRTWVGLFLMAIMIFMYSCKKDAVKQDTKTDYTYFKVSTVNDSGIIYFSDIKTK